MKAERILRRNSVKELDTKLTVKLDGNDVVIDVIDIVESPEYNKEYIFYTIDGVPNQEIFASILNETDDSYSLDTIENDEEFDYVNQLIAKMSLDFEEELETVSEKVEEPAPLEPVIQAPILESAKAENEELVYNITDTKEPEIENNATKDDEIDTNQLPLEEPIIEAKPEPSVAAPVEQASNFDFDFDIEKTTNPMAESDNETVGE